MYTCTDCISVLQDIIYGQKCGFGSGAALCEQEASLKVNVLQQKDEHQKDEQAAS